MFDPGAIGTLRIGLDRVRHEQELYERGVAIAARPVRHRGGMRRGIAAFLRRTAALLDPAPAPAG